MNIQGRYLNVMNFYIRKFEWKFHFPFFWKKYCKNWYIFSRKFECYFIIIGANVIHRNFQEVSETSRKEYDDEKEQLKLELSQTQAKDKEIMERMHLRYNCLEKLWVHNPE